MRCSFRWMTYPMDSTDFGNSSVASTTARGTGSTADRLGRWAVARSNPVHHNAEDLVFGTAGVDRHHRVVPDRAQRVRLRRAELGRADRPEGQLRAWSSRPTSHANAPSSSPSPGYNGDAGPANGTGHGRRGRDPRGVPGPIRRPHRAHKTPPPATFRAHPCLQRLVPGPILVNRLPDLLTILRQIGSKAKYPRAGLRTGGGFFHSAGIRSGIPQRRSGLNGTSGERECVMIPAESGTCQR